MKLFLKICGMAVCAVVFAALVSGVSRSVWVAVPQAHAEPAAKANHLADAFSPYLRQHMYNPVDWHPWGEEALRRAKKENKPILVSIGYATCYWCHVLERETFSDPVVAKLMNEHFINIKVDREVRPDIDKLYLAATQAMTGRGGWPNNLLLTPDLQPFYAVTYLPRNAWLEMVRQYAAAWGAQPATVRRVAARITANLREYFTPEPPLFASISAEGLALKAVAGMASLYDARNGGFGTGNKFPMETHLLFLLTAASTGTNNPAFEMVKKTVDNMIAGGIHDHVGGGFHRYATETTWSVPHFEKMLYTQGMMASVLSGLYERTGDETYKRTLERLLAYVLRDMMEADSGAFFSAEDAETDAVEGDFYVWNNKTLKNVLGQDGYNFLMSQHEIKPLPHFPGHKYPDGGVLRRKSVIVPANTQVKQLDNLMENLLIARDKRKRPLRDDKVLTAWNGMMMEGFANAGRVLDNPVYVAAAEKAAAFFMTQMDRHGGKLFRINMNGQVHQAAFLEDYAWLAKGLMAVYRATGDAQYKERAIVLMKDAHRIFGDTDTGSGYYLTDGSENLPVRLKAADDGAALPAPASVMASVFSDLYTATQETVWRDKMDDTLAAVARDMMVRPSAYGYAVRTLLQTGQMTQEQWVQPVIKKTKVETDRTVKKNPEKPLSLQPESKDKVAVTAQLLPANNAEDKSRTVEIRIDIEDGWHINAHPASLDFLVPTVADVQTGTDSTVKITYPAPHSLKTPLGEIDVYDGSIRIRAEITDDEEMNVDDMRLLLQVQACRGTTCYPPSQISLPVLHKKC